ncbi:MAG: protein prkA [bacterium]|nr:protein prkA [bacterium]
MTGENVEKRNFNSIFERIKDSHEDQERLKWNGTFEEYVEKVVENPDLARNAQKSVYKAITNEPDFFKSGKNALYGSEGAVDRFTELMRQGAEGYESGKRIILLLGPPGSGKSTLVNGTKRGMEAFSKTDEGAIYAIDGCQMHEDPLHLIPEDMRPALEEEYGVKIEGHLCPQCEQKYGAEAKDPETGKAIDLKAVKVKRVILSEDRRIGIGTFKPSDPKSQDITELTGSVNLKGLEEHGVASNPNSFNFDGELNVANRGVMEFVEILKSDPKFLYSLLDLAQDRTIKTGRFGNISADEVIIAHTNLSEYKKFMSDDKNEALRDRMIVVEVPYALRVSDEKKIYEKLVNQTDKIKNAETHLSPRSLEIASMFSVLSRLKSSTGKYSKLQKMAAYDGNKYDASHHDVTEMIDDGKEQHEGMTGISPRFVIDAISNAMEDDKECLSPIDIFRALREQIGSSPYTKNMKPEERKELVEDLQSSLSAYNVAAKKEVERAYTLAFEENAQTQCNNYVENVLAFCNKETRIDSAGIEREPDERLMRSIEQNMSSPVSESGKREFRQQIAFRLASASRKQEDYDFMNYPGLREAIEQKLFAENKDSLQLTLNSNAFDKKQQKKLNILQQTLVDERGYCEHCATELIDYAGSLIQDS